MWWYIIPAIFGGLALGIITGKYFQARGEGVRLELARDEAVQQERKQMAGNRLTPAQNIERVKNLKRNNTAALPYTMINRVLQGGKKNLLVEVLAFIGPASPDGDEILHQVEQGYYEIYEMYPYSGTPREMAMIGGILYLVRYAEDLTRQDPTNRAMQLYIKRHYPCRRTAFLRELLDEQALSSLKKSARATMAVVGMSETQMLLQGLQLHPEEESPPPDLDPLINDETLDPQGLEALLEAGIGEAPQEWQPATTTAEDPNGFVPPVPTAPVPNPTPIVVEELSPAPTLEEPPIVDPRQTMWRERGHLVPDPLPPPLPPTSPAPAREHKRTMIGGLSASPVPGKKPQG